MWGGVGYFKTRVPTPYRKSLPSCFGFSILLAIAYSPVILLLSPLLSFTMERVHVVLTFTQGFSGVKSLGRSSAEFRTP